MTAGYRTSTGHHPLGALTVYRQAVAEGRAAEIRAEDGRLLARWTPGCGSDPVPYGLEGMDRRVAEGARRLADMEEARE